MALTQLLYVSRRTPLLKRDVLEAIVERSALANARRNITRVLLCCGTGIMQLLEGELADVKALYDVIEIDPRHDQVHALVCKSVRKRLFPEWGMGMADLDRKGTLDTRRLMQLVQDIRAMNDTSHFGVEARVLLSDFKQQLNAA